MATVQTVLDGSKYDLRNYGAMEFDDDQMIHYLNRAIALLDRELIALNSDQTLTEGSVTLTSGTDVSAVPTRCVNIRQIWNSDEEMLYKASPAWIYERRMHRDGDTAEPNYYAHIQNNIEFEVTADATYTLTAYYDTTSAVLTAVGNTMPYNDVYNEYLRETIVMMARSRKDKKFIQTDSAYSAVFRAIVQQDMINRNFVPKFIPNF